MRDDQLHAEQDRLVIPVQRSGQRGALFVRCVTGKAAYGMRNVNAFPHTRGARQKAYPRGKGAAD